MKVTQMLIAISLFFAVLLGLHFVINQFFALHYWNSTTPILYFFAFLVSLLGIILLAKVKQKDAKLFVQGFLAYTVLQFLIIITSMLIVVTLSPETARKFAVQLLFVSFLTIVFQSVFLARVKTKNA